MSYPFDPAQLRTATTLKPQSARPLRLLARRTARQARRNLRSF